MTTYQVTALYERPEIQRSVRIEANSREEAMVKAILEHRIPVFFSRDQYGWLQAEFWQPEMGGRYRWPQVKTPDTLFWANEKKSRILRFDIQVVSGDKRLLKIEPD